VNISDAIDPDLSFLISPGSDPNQDYLMNKTYSHFNSSVYDPDPIGFVDPDLNPDPGRQNYLQKRKHRNFVV
jgi:hypothetical protein